MNYRKLKLTKYIQSMVDRVIQRLIDKTEIRQQDGRNEMQFCSVSGSGIVDVMKCLVKKDLYLFAIRKLGVFAYVFTVYRMLAVELE